MQLRDALKMQGQIEQAEGRARFTKDKSHTESDDFKELKAKFEQVESSTTKQVQKVSHAVRFKRQTSDGDEEFERREDRPRGGRQDGDGRQRGGQGQQRRNRRDMEDDDGDKDNK